MRMYCWIFYSLTATAYGSGSPIMSRLVSCKLLVEDRRRMVDEKTRGLNRLTQRLKMYFPQVLSWFGSVDSVLVWRFLEQWPDLESLRKARRSSLKGFLERDGRCSPPEIEELWPTIRNAIPATQDAAVIATSILFVKTIVRQLQLLHEAIREYDKRIEQVTETHPDFPLVRSFPGVGEGTRATTDRRAGHAARPILQRK